MQKLTRGWVIVNHEGNLIELSLVYIIVLHDVQFEKNLGWERVYVLSVLVGNSWPLQIGNKKEQTTEGPNRKLIFGSGAGF